MICHAVQYSDQMNCGVCQLAWDVNDPDPPNCTLNTVPSKREWGIAADRDKIEMYRNEPKMYNKLMSMHMELLAKENKVTNHKRRVEDFSIEQLDAGDFKVHHKSSSPIAQDNQIEKHDAMSFDAYQDPKHLDSKTAEDLAGNVIESVERNRLIMNPPEEWGDKPASIDATLKERGNRYGNFAEEARIKHNIKRAMKDSENWSKLSLDKKHALGMVAVKLARILNGDTEYVDNWHDIVGYTKLVADRLLEKK